MSTATESDRKNVWHPEIRAHAPDEMRGCRLPGKSSDQKAQVGGCAADIHDDRVLQTGQKGRAPDAIRRAGGAGYDRKARCVTRRYECAVVLAEVDLRANAQLAERVLQ